jgi:hypothetical protein
MSQQHSDPKSNTPAPQPSSIELSAEELDRVTGGDKSQTQTTTKPTISAIHFTKVVDKSPPNLF